jgi:hypothetical protein
MIEKIRLGYDRKGKVRIGKGRLVYVRQGRMGYN